MQSDSLLRMNIKSKLAEFHKNRICPVVSGKLNYGFNKEQKNYYRAPGKLSSVNFIWDK